MSMTSSVCENFQQVREISSEIYREYYLRRYYDYFVSLTIQACPKERITPRIYSEDAIGTLNPILGMGMDS